jgi:hypothetical protein
MKAFAAALGLALARGAGPAAAQAHVQVGRRPGAGRRQRHRQGGRPVPDQAAGDFTLTVDGKPRRIVSAQFISVDRAVDSVPPSKPMEYNSNTSAQGGRLVMIAVDSNMASAVHARRCHGARGG